MRPVNNMIEFKQIIGRGTRLFEDKFYFTVVDFVGAYVNFSDPEWDGDPVPDEPPRTPPGEPPEPPTPGDLPGEPPEPPEPKEKIVIKLAEGKELTIKSMSTNLFYFQGQPVSAEEFIKKLFNTINIPNFFKSSVRQNMTAPNTDWQQISPSISMGFLIELISGKAEAF